MDDAQSKINDESVRRVLSGDRDAFRPIVDQHLPHVRAMIVGRSLPGVDVDEVVQRSFVEAYKNIADYRLGTNFRAWLLTIAKFQLMAETTRVRRMSDYHTKYAPEALARRNQSMLELADGSDQRLQFLSACLAEIQESGREVLRLRYEKDRSYKEIATVLDRSAGAIRKQLCLLRQQLHQCISVKLASESMGENHA